ncbi:MAG: helix-turn-helix transcriptional regulator [Methylophilaceae bacterium]
MSRNVNDFNKTLQYADLLPDTAMVRLPVVKGLFGVSGATVWRMVKAGNLKTYKLTERTTTFNMGEIRALLNSKRVGE